MKKLERFVQTIPYGRPLSKTKIKINDKGEIVIYGKDKTWHVENLDKAIRQQLFHCLYHYEDTVIFRPKKIKHKGEINELNIIAKQIEALIESKFLSDSSKLFNEITGLKVSLEKIQENLNKRETKNFSIVKKILARAEILIKEKERCDQIIKNAVLNLIEIISKIQNKDSNNINWNLYFDAIKKLRTVYANPYREKTQLKLYKTLQYEIFKLVKKCDFAKAESLLWKGLEKLIPLYSGELTMKLGNKKIIIKDRIMQMVK